jgi:uncharacterized DUF497 family protein
MGFQWDPAKEAANLQKHGVSFRQAVEIFRGLMLIGEDIRRDYGERRYIAIDEFDREVIRVIYTERDGDIRIISAWKANRHDRQAYAAHKQSGEI